MFFLSIWNCLYNISYINFLYVYTIDEETVIWKIISMIPGSKFYTRLQMEVCMNPPKTNYSTVVLYN